MTITEKTAYLKGLMEGLKINTEEDTGKLLSVIVDTLDEVALAIDDIDTHLDEIDAEIEDIEEVVEDLEDAVEGHDEELEFDLSGLCEDEDENQDEE